jgi:predicted HAD superfamily phosphohydrolase
MEQERIKAVSTISMIGMARRAVYGYAMLLDSMGLPKDQREMVRQVENSITSMMRLMQTIRVLDLTIKAFEAGMGPMGWVYLAMAGGMAAATMMYGQRSLGG